MKKRKRLLPSIIVALTLMVSIALSQFTGLALFANSPKPRAQTTVETVSDLNNALTSANSGDTIVLADNFPTGTAKIFAPVVDVILDANHVDLNTSEWTIEQSGNGKLTLNNFVFTGVGLSSAIVVLTPSKIVFNNLCVANRYSYGDGGAIAMKDDANVEIYNSTFHNNTVHGTGYTGGAIAAKGFRGSLTIKNSVFTENKKLNLAIGAAGSQGGAIYIYNIYATAKIQIIDSYFSKNEAVKNAAAETNPNLKKETADGGAIAFFNIVNGAEITIDGSTFAENVAGDDAGAILVQTNDDVASGIRITNSTFYKNSALAASASLRNGGAIQFYANGGGSTSRKSYVVMENNTFFGNSSVKQGGAIAFAFAGYSNRVFAETKNSLFVDNIASTENTRGLANNGIAKTNNLGGNVGYDNGSAPLEGTAGTALDVFGTDTPALHANNSNVKAGYENTGIVGGKKALAIPTLMILPDSIVDNVGVESTLLKDARGFVRSTTAKDSGAVEIGFLAFDANGGIFANELPVTAYDGTRHTISNGDGKVTKVFNVSNIAGTATAPTAPAHPDGSPFRGWSLTIDGAILTADELQAQLGTLTSGVTLHAIYANSSTVTVHHVDEDGKALADAVTLNGFVGNPYTTQAVTIAGYTLKTTPTNATGDYTAENINVTYVYSANPATVTVHHVDEDGKALASAVVVNGIFGTDYTTLPIDIVGYTLKATPDNSIGSFEVENTDVTYIYEKVEEPTTEEPTTQEPTIDEPTTSETTTDEPTTGTPTASGKGTDTPSTGDKGITFTLATFALTAVLIGVMSAKKRKEESN